MSRFLTTAFVIPGVLFSTAAPAVPAATAKRVATKPAGCTLQPLAVAIDASSFEGVPAMHRPDAVAKLKANFSASFVSAFADLCKARRITPAAFRGVDRIVLRNAEGDTDGHFYKANMPRGSIGFDFLFSDASAPIRDGINHGLECLARPVGDCFED